MSEARAEEPSRVLPLWLQLALWAIAAAIVAAWLALAVIHVNDEYRVTHYQGVWIAVAEEAREGRLYPPAFDGEHYAGTRYMPLPILLNAFATKVIGDPLAGGKVLAAVLMASLLALVFFTLRWSFCPPALAGALAAVVVATDTGLQAGSAIGGDLLPLVLQIGALAIVVRCRGRVASLIAGGLAGLAIASKLTGGWAWLAIVTWYVMQRKWRSAATFSMACAATASLVLGTVQLLTGGGLSEHLLAFSTAGVQGSLSILRGPNQILFNLLGHASATVVLVPLAAIGMLLRDGWRRLSVVHLALVYAVVLLLGVYADVGTGPNQLLDVVVLTTLAAGLLASRAAALHPPIGRIAVQAVAVTVIWAAGLDLVRTVGFDLRGSVSAITAGASPRRDVAAVVRMVQPGEEVLAEDPSIDVALGRRPIVMDPFMVMALERRRPQEVDPLISWISNQRFDLVVLVVSLEDRDVDYWWSDFHFGARVAKALRTSYVFDRHVGRYFAYRRLQRSRETQ
jgi:hypothetical protein